MCRVVSHARTAETCTASRSFSKLIWSDACDETGCMRCLLEPGLFGINSGEPVRRDVCNETGCMHCLLESRLFCANSGELIDCIRSSSTSLLRLGLLGNVGSTLIGSCLEPA